ncbi:MAG: peptidoglycan-associated lipoprotein Pal [Bacteriovoracaceae bacterium]
MNNLRKTKQSNLFFAAILSVTLGTGACTKKNEKKAGDESPVVSVVDSEDALTGSSNPGAGTLEVNGSSDQNKAGAIQTVYFDLDSSDISGATKESLNANAEFLKANTSVKVLVEGHCDERGGTQYNLALGEKRARSVKDYLVAMGVDAKRIETKSMGKESPLDFGHDEAAWSKNRRGSFVVIAK